MRRLMPVALAASTLVAAFGMASPAAAGKADKGSGCAVQHVDERGQPRGTSSEPEGTVRGEFRCVDGAWRYSWAPFGPDDFVAAAQLQVDPKGGVWPIGYERLGHRRQLTLGERADIARAFTGARAVAITRVLVAVDDGRQRTSEEILALFAGKDATGAKVLRTVDRPDPAATVGDIIDGVDDGPVVVYFLSEIWDGIVGFFAWVGDVIDGIGDWIDENCIWFPPPPPGSTDIPIIHCEWAGEQQW
jgi:hypothetical protein